MASLSPPGALAHPWDDPSRGLPPPSWPFQFGEPLVLPIIDCCQSLGHPWSVTPVAWMPWPLTAFHLGWAHWTEARYPLPYPAYVFKHKRDGCPYWQHTSSLAHPWG